MKRREDFRVTHANHVGPMASAIWYRNTIVGYITENYDFSGRGSFSARLGADYWTATWLPNPVDRRSAIEAVISEAMALPD